MPSPSLKCRNSAISSTVATLEKPHFIGRFSAYSLMEKLRGRYEWRRERNWGRTFSTYPIVPERAPADVVHVPRATAAQTAVCG
jgi:hypothetical protein